MLSFLNWLLNDLKLYEGFWNFEGILKDFDIFQYLWSYSIYDFIDFCHKDFFGALLQNCLDQEVEKSSNYFDKLI